MSRASTGSTGRQVTRVEDSVRRREEDESAGAATNTMSVASLLRRPSPSQQQQGSGDGSPTRTLRLTEQERAASRDTTPVQRGLESLSRRPRSNPRNRTPMRHESPLNPHDLRPDSASRGSRNGETDRAAQGTAAAVAGAGRVQQQQQRQQEATNDNSRRITIRPLAGSAVGTVVSTRILEEGRRSETPSRSRKQGPSHRKVRRWNNDHFVDLAAEIASSSSFRNGHVAADVLIRAHEKAHLHRPIYDPKEHVSEKLRGFLKDDNLKDLRDRFFEGELPNRPVESGARRQSNSRLSSSGAAASGEEMIRRIDPRLRRVVVKACTNSYPATLVVESFERYVLSSFSSSGKKSPRRDTKNDDGRYWWEDLLLERPTLTERKDGKITSQFYFDAESSTGGFHRLLLHAVCQFHGLSASSRMVEISIGDQRSSRMLSVSGARMEEVSVHRLVDQIEKMEMAN